MGLEFSKGVVILRSLRSASFLCGIGIYKDAVVVFLLRPTPTLQAVDDYTGELTALIYGAIVD